MIYSRRITITLLLSAASCFQFAGGIPVSCIEPILTRFLSNIPTITTIDGCESVHYNIWIHAGRGHISLIGEPIMDNNKESGSSNNGGDGLIGEPIMDNSYGNEDTTPGNKKVEDNDPKNGTSSSVDNRTSCPTLVFDDGGEKLDKVIVDLRLLIPNDNSFSGNQDSGAVSNQDLSAWKKDAMRLHKTNYKNANQNRTTSSFVLSEVTAAYHHAMRRLGDYDIFSNNCATFVLNMMAELGIKVDDHMIKFAASELYKNHSVIAPVLQNQTFMEDLFLEFDHYDTTTTTSSHKTTTTGLLRNRNHYQAQTAAAGVVADSLEGAELFVEHYVKEWSSNQH